MTGADDIIIDYIIGKIDSNECAIRCAGNDKEVIDYFNGANTALKELAVDLGIVEERFFN